MTKPTILVIDDSELCLELTRDALEDAGFAVITSASADDARALIDHARPACVVLDVSMPSVRGDSLAAHLRGSGGVQVPIVLHSAMPLAELAPLARTSGAAGAASKSHDGADLIAAIRDLLAQG